MAAAGQQIAMPASAMSSASAAPAAGPMQADKMDRRIKRHSNKVLGLSRKLDTVPEGSSAYNKIFSKYEKEREKTEALKLKRIGKQARKAKTWAEDDMDD